MWCYWGRHKKKGREGLVGIFSFHDFFRPCRTFLWRCMIFLFFFAIIFFLVLYLASGAHKGSCLHEFFLGFFPIPGYHFCNGPSLRYSIRLNLSLLINLFWSSIVAMILTNPSRMNKFLNSWLGRKGVARGVLWPSPPPAFVSLFQANNLRYLGDNLESTLCLTQYEPLPPFKKSWLRPCFVESIRLDPQPFWNWPQTAQIAYPVTGNPIVICGT